MSTECHASVPKQRTIRKSDHSCLVDDESLKRERRLRRATCKGISLVNRMPNSAASDEHGTARVRTSVVLRSILTKNPDLETFSIAQIIASIGDERPEASLMVFAMPAIIPVPRPLGSVAVPAAAVGCQLVTGGTRIRLPQSILRKQVSRRALAVAIHAMIPIVEATEKVVRPRWTWASQPISRRAIGVLVFLLALSMACPLIGFEALHAISLFVVSLGMAEADGLAITIGVVAGILALAIGASSGLSLRAVRAKLGKMMRSLAKKLGLEAFARYLESRGYRRIASLLRFDWTDLLMRWDPEGRYARAPAANTQDISPRESINQDISRKRTRRQSDIGVRLPRVA
ncbi:MAG: exopolysaccharide biosynthesis protein [Polyangiales bacterium]